MRTILFALLIFLGNNGFAQDVPVKFEITNLKSSEGSILVSIYKSKKSFDDGVPSAHKVIPKKGKMNKGVLRHNFRYHPVFMGWYLSMMRIMMER